MRLPVFLILALLLSAFAAHALTLHLTPRLAMDAAMRRLSRDGALINVMTRADRVGEGSRSAERPSADFAESACAYDLHDGPLRVRANAWDDYWSVSFYADNSDNFFTANDRESPDGVDIVLVRGRKRAPETSALVVSSPTRKGVIVIRRLAPTPSSFEAAQAAAQGDECARFSQDVAAPGSAFAPPSS